jgi:hypothetical protein
MNSIEGNISSGTFLLFRHQEKRSHFCETDGTRSMDVSSQPKELKKKDEIG